ncbi:MAG: Panacea domain-containing protein [Deferribacterales bacterium]
MKIIQIINYFTRLSGNKINKLKLIKLIYFTDKYHLRKYGRTATNDEYWAMKRGPVQSVTKDLIDGTDFLSPKELEYRKSYIMKEGNTIASLCDVNEDYLSDSEISAMDFIWEQYGKLTHGQLIDKSHENIEWKKYEDRLNAGSAREKMNIIDFFSDSNDELSKSTANGLDESKAIFEENEAIKSLLRI